MEERQKRIIKLAVGVALGILLYAGWIFAPGVRAGMGDGHRTDGGVFWDRMDLEVFYRLNGSLAEPGPWRDALAMANNRWFDLVPAAVMFVIYSFFVYSVGGRERRRRIVLGAFMLIWMLVSVQAMSKLAFRFDRTSPTETEGVSPAIRISKLYEGRIKDASSSSFPGDHATVLLLFTGFTSYYGRRKRYIIPATATAIVFSLPRVFSGGHWLSDIIVGSGSTALVFLPIAFYTPLTDKCVAVLDRPVNAICDFLGIFIPALRADRAAKADQSNPAP